MPSRQARRLRRRGFTLVEVMVALVVMAVLAAMAWQGVDAMIRTREITQANVERSLRLTNVLGQWEQDLAAVVNVQRGSIPGLAFDGQSLRLVRRSGDGLQIVVWALREGALLRWASQVTTRAAQLQDYWQQSNQLLGNEAAQLRTLDGLNAIQVYFYRDNSWSNAQSTGDVAIVPGTAASGVAASLTQRLPDGVRLVLGFAAEGADLRLTRDVLMPPQP